jgi:transposase
MNVKSHQVRKVRTYSEDFKREVVSSFESGRFSVLQLEKLYGIPNPTIYGWIYKFSIFNKKGYRVVEKNESSSEKLRQMEQRIRELEQAVGQKQIKIEYLEKMIDLAKSELDIDIKKNFSTPPSDGSGKTGKG